MLIYLWSKGQELSLLYAHLKNGMYYITGYDVRQSVNLFVSG